MKKLCFLLVIALAFSNVWAQQINTAQVPAAVKEAFQKQYPKAVAVKWEKEAANFEAEFKLNKTGMSVLFDAAGAVLETETEIAVSSLPQNTHTYLDQKFPGQKIKEATRIVNIAGRITYEVEVGGKDYLFDLNGDFIETL